jgi:hypothetical protein
MAFAVSEVIQTITLRFDQERTHSGSIKVDGPELFLHSHGYGKLLKWHPKVSDSPAADIIYLMTKYFPLLFPTTRKQSKGWSFSVRNIRNTVLTDKPLAWPSEEQGYSSRKVGSYFVMARPLEVLSGPRCVADAPRFIQTA